jgi:glycosyltransferase involved in cell wall biosynthesis
MDMADTIRVSSVIPTYNRAELVQRAIDSVLAQTRPVDEIIVVDDGSSDGTRELLQARYGERIVYRWQPNAGVSAARNAGMALARGRYIALLDSDDIWMPEKTARQLAYLEANPRIGMVVCDVAQADPEGRRIDVFRRRDVLPRDGWVLAEVLANPALAPASAMFRREVFEDVGGFDPTLRTAEDLDFHLRVASRWQIGVVEETLVEVMRGNPGLSVEATYHDDVTVVERAVAACAGSVDARARRRALAMSYIRSARGLMIRRHWPDAWRMAGRALRAAPDGASRREVLRLASFATRRVAASLLRR